MNIKKYLERIGLPADIKPQITYDFLKKVQLAHLYSVPYENVDVLDGIPLCLDIEKLYEKVVLRGRGGWCFELNSLFEYLLKELGFTTQSYFARFWRGETTVPYRRHRVIAVFLDGKTYIVDVGIGAVAPRIPLLLEEGLVQEYFGESYCFRREEEYGWVLYELKRGEWCRYFSFTVEKQFESDFAAISYFCQYNEASTLNKNYMVALKTEKGRKSVDGSTFKEFVGKELARIEENMTDERRREIFEKEFGLVTGK